MRRISSDIEEKIIEMWFEGYTREYTAKTLDIGEATVSDIIGTLPSCLRIARDIAVANRKHNLTQADAWKGLEVAAQIAAVGVTPEQIPSFIQTVKKMSADTEYEPSRVILAAMELSNLETQSGRKYAAAIEDFKTAIEKKRELDKENEKRTKENLELQLETEENRRLRNETLERANTTPKELSEYFDCKAAFREYGMNINHAKTIRKVLDNIKEADGNAKHVVSLVKKHDSIAKSVAYYERQLPTKQEECANLFSQIKEYQKIVSQLQNEQEQLESIINSQKNAFNSNNYQLYLIQANIAELENRRQGLITWIGKQLNLPHEEIENLRFDSEHRIVLAILDNKLRDAAARAMNSLRATLEDCR